MNTEEFNFIDFVITPVKEFFHIEEKSNSKVDLISNKEFQKIDKYELSKTLDVYYTSNVNQNKSMVVLIEFSYFRLFKKNLKVSKFYIVPKFDTSEDRIVIWFDIYNRIKKIKKLIQIKIGTCNQERIENLKNIMMCTFENSSQS